MTGSRLRKVWIIPLAGAALVVEAQNAVITFSVDGGGGTSTAGVYRVSGNIAQPTVARLNSHDFTIDGGFHGIVAGIPEPGAPLLSLRLKQTNSAVVSWPMAWPGFVLQDNQYLNTTNWLQVPVVPVAVAVAEDRVEKQVVLPLAEGDRFYRLKRP